MAIVPICWRFQPLNPGLLNSRSFGERSGIGAGAVVRHDELIGKLVYLVTAAMPHRKNRNLA